MQETSKTDSKILANILTKIITKTAYQDVLPRFFKKFQD